MSEELKLLKESAIYLAGLKDGGKDMPIGTIHIDALFRICTMIPIYEKTIAGEEDEQLS